MPSWNTEKSVSQEPLLTQPLTSYFSTCQALLRPLGLQSFRKKQSPLGEPWIDIPALLSFPVLLWGLRAGHTDSLLSLLLRNYEDSSQSTQTVSSFIVGRILGWISRPRPYVVWSYERLKGECWTKLKASSLWAGILCLSINLPAHSPSFFQEGHEGLVLQSQES